MDYRRIAYGSFYDIKGRLWGINLLRRTDSVMAARELTFEGDEAAVVEWDEFDLEKPIQGSALTLRIISEADREWTSLYTVDDGDVVAEVTLEGGLWWRGSLDPETYEEPYERAQDYTVELRFSDFGPLKRHRFSLPGDGGLIKTGEALGINLLTVGTVTALSSDGLPSNADISSIAPPEGQTAADMLATGAGEDAFREDTDSTDLIKAWDALEALLTASGLRMTQRAGKIMLYNLKGIRDNAGSKAEECVWSGDSQTLGADRIASRVVVSHSGDGDGNLIRELKTGREQDELAGSNVFYHSRDDYESFELSLYRTSTWGSSMLSSYFFTIRGKLDNVADADGWVMYVADAKGELGLSKNPPQPVAYGNPLSGITASFISTPPTYIHLTTPHQPGYPPKSPYRIRIEQEMLFDRRTNPFNSDEDYTGGAMKGDEYEDVRMANVLAFLKLETETGETYYYSNNHYKTSGSHKLHAGCDFTSGWWSKEMAPYWIQYRPKTKMEKGYIEGAGWVRNQAFTRTYPSIDWKKIEIDNYTQKLPDGDFIPLPPVRGWLTLHICNSIEMLGEKLDGTKAVKALHWVLGKGAAISIVDANSNFEMPESSESEVKVICNNGAEDDTCLSPLLGSGGGFLGCRTLLIDSDGAASEKGVPELRTASEIASQLCMRRTRLTGEAYINTSAPLSFTERLQTGRVFMLVSERIDLQKGFGDRVITELLRTDIDGLEVRRNERVIFSATTDRGGRDGRDAEVYSIIPTATAVSVKSSTITDADGNVKVATEYVPAELGCSVYLTVGNDMTKSRDGILKRKITDANGKTISNVIVDTDGGEAAPVAVPKGSASIEFKLLSDDTDDAMTLAICTIPVDGGSILFPDYDQKKDTLNFRNLLGDFYLKDSIDLSKYKDVSISTGTGLTGGGTLEEDRTLSLDESGVDAGTYTKITVDKYGRATKGDYLLTSDIPTLAISKISGLQAALDAKLEKTVFTELFEKVNIGTASAPIYAIKAKLGLYTDQFLSARGLNGEQTEVSAGLDKTQLAKYLSDYGYATQSWVSGRGFLTSSALTGYATQDWVKNQNYLTSHQSLANYVTLNTAQTIGGLKTFTSYTKHENLLMFKASNATKGIYLSPLESGALNFCTHENYGWKSTFGSIDLNGNLKMQAFVKDGGTSAQFLKADGSVDATSYLASSAYTASDILTKLKTIDGSGSGLDADLLDGYHESVFFKTTRGSIPTAFIDITDYNKGAADYANYASGTYSIQRSGYSSVFINFAHNSGGSTSALQLMTNYEDNASLKFRKTIDSNRVSGPWRTILTELNIGSFNAGSATKLQTARTLWGQSFDGTANVSGNMTSVGNITGSAAIVMTANGRLTLNATATAVDLKFNNTDAKSVILNGTAFKPFDAADNALDLGTDVARWKKITACNMRLSSSTSGAGNDVYAELWRGSNASWRMLNTSGVLKFQSNYTDKAGSYFDCFTLAYNTGNAYLKGSLGIGNTAPSYPLDVNGNIRAQSGWFRNTGNNGWYNETYGGGIYMNDSIWIRTYGNKALLVDVSNANAWGIGGHRLNALFQGAAHASILLRVTDNSVAYGIAANTNGNMYFGKRTNGDAYSHTNDAYLMVLNSTGLYIGGGASPAYRLDVNGTARVNSLVIGSCTITYENGGLRFSSGIYSDEFVSARGVNSSGSGSGSGVSYNRLDNWTDYASGKEGYVLSSKLGYDLYSNKADKSALSSYVTLGTAQTIAGAKTFSSSIVCSQGNAGNWWSGTTPRGKFVATNGGNTQGWSPVLGFKTVTGKCEFGSLNDNIHINYYADTVTTNAYTHQLTLPKKTGTLAVTSDITSALASYLPLSGGTLTGVLHLLASQYPDTANTGALNLNNSDIYGVNSIKFADLCDSAAEGLQWYRDSTHIDSFWVKSGVMYFTPNRAWGGTGTDNVVLHSGNYTSYVTKVGTSTVGSASKPIYLSGGTPTASSSTIGSASVPVFLSSGTITKCTASSIFSSLTTSDKSISITIAGQTRTLTVPYASSAGKLSSSHTIWGQKFNGSSGVEGELSNVSGINFTSSGAFKIDKYGNLVATTSSTNTWNVYKSDASTKILSLMCDASVGFVKVTNFGIGTASPSYKLDVNGTARAKKLIADTIYTDGQIQVGANGEKFLVDETGYVTVGDYLNVKGGAIFFGDMMIDQMVNDIEIYNPKSGKLYYNGICDFTGLEVSGDTNLAKLAVNTEQFVVSGNSVSIGTSYTLANSVLFRKHLVISNASVFFTSTGNGTGEGLWITPEGTYNNKKYLGLMKHTNRSWTADCCRFFFDGTFWAKTGIYSDGYVSARGQNTSSDERLKQGFTPFEIALRQIAGAPSVGFSWKKDGSRDVGSIAQYWKGINPLLTPEDNDGFLTLQYGKTALLASITIAKKTLEHEGRIARLERENKELKRIIEILERR